MKKLITAIILGLLILSAPLQATAKINRDVAFDVDIKGFLILNYYSELHLVVNAFENFVDEGNGGIWTMDWAATPTLSGGNELTTTTLNDPGSGTFPATATVTIPNCWALRGVTASGNAKVSIDFNPSGATQDLTKGTSKVTASNLQVSQAGTTAANVTFPVAGLLKSKAKLGDVVMDLDITNVTEAGLHTGGKFTLTAEAI